MKAINIKAAAAIAALLISSSAALAAPIAPAAIGVQPGDHANIIQVAKRDHHRGRGHRHHGRRHHHWRGHHHWRHGPPRGWRRYHARPWDWRRRGCILFGPIWFCP